MVVTRGNFFRRGDPAGPNPNPYQMTEDTVVTGGNFVLCRVVTNGFNLDIQGGNVRGLYIDGVKQDTFVYQRYEPLALAGDILGAAQRAGGDDAVAAWLWSVQWIIDNQTSVYADWHAAYIAWADSIGNMVYSAAMFVRLRDRFFPGMGYNAVRDAILAYDYAAWAGGPTQLVEEYS